MQGCSRTRSDREADRRGERFTTFAILADITVPEEGMEERAQRLLEKAENLCLITNSLRGETRLEVRVVRAAGTP